VIMPPRSELDMLQVSFRAAFEKWRGENPRNGELFKLAETEIAKARSGD
jgi:hypothetical protein